MRRSGGGVGPAQPELVLAAGDTLVLSGLPEPLSRVEAMLMRR